MDFFGAAPGSHRGISASLRSACKLFACKCYLHHPKGAAAAFLPSVAITFPKPVFIIDAASALTGCHHNSADLGVVSAAASVHKQRLQTVWAACTVSLLTAPFLPPHLQCGCCLQGPWLVSSSWQKLHGARDAERCFGVHACVCATVTVLTATLRGFWKMPVKEKYCLTSTAETQA